MPQEDPVKKARINAYLSSGVILVLSLLIFFYFHQQEDKKSQQQIASLQSQLADTQKSTEQLKQAAGEAQKALPDLQKELETLKVSYDDLTKTSAQFQKQYAAFVNSSCYDDIAQLNISCIDRLNEVSSLSQDVEKKVSDTTTKLKSLDESLKNKSEQAKNSRPVTQPTPATERASVSEIAAVEEDKSQTVYITRTGAKYHRAGCQYLSKSMIPIIKKDAIARGFTPCSRCNP